jgi:hypothetical protein
MNFLRTMSLQRLVDTLKVKLNGQTWTTQSTLDIVPGHGVQFVQTEGKDTTTLTLGVGDGTTGVLGYWGGFYDTTTQSISSTTTAYVVTLNGSDPNNDGVSITSGSRITFAHLGVYNVCTSIQFQNTDTQIHDATIWFRKNGVDVANSASYVSIPNSHGGVPGNLIFYVDLPQKLQTGDYMEIVWRATNTAVTLATLPAGASPTRPAAPSVLITVHQI